MRKLPDGVTPSASGSSRGLYGLRRATEPERVLAHTGRQACLRLSDIHLQTVRYLETAPDNIVNPMAYGVIQRLSYPCIEVNAASIGPTPIGSMEIAGVDASGEASK
jgi:hypothetical protein